MNDNYGLAVAFATDFLSKGNHGEQTHNYRVEPTEFLYRFGLQIERTLMIMSYARRIIRIQKMR